MEINRDEFEQLKIEVKTLARKLKTYKKQNIRIVKRLRNLLSNQRFYVKNRMVKLKLMKVNGKEFSKTLAQYEETRRTMMKFLGSTTLPKGSRDPNRNVFTKLTSNEYRRLLKKLAPRVPKSKSPDL